MDRGQIFYRPAASSFDKVGQAWEDMHTEDGDMIRQAFRQVGLGLPIDGSQDHDIKIKDFLRFKLETGRTGSLQRREI